MRMIERKLMRTIETMRIKKQNKNKSRKHQCRVAFQDEELKSEEKTADEERQLVKEGGKKVKVNKS